MNIKKDFPIFTHNPSLAYLDSAAMSQVPEQVIAAITTYHAEYRANVHRGMYAEAEHASEAYEEARKKVAAFIHARAEEIIFTSGATASLNILALMLERSLDISPQNTIVSTVMEHHSSLLPFRELARRKGARFSIIPLTDTYDLDFSELKDRIPEGTKIIVVTLASNVLGTINDIAPIVTRAREVGACVVVDAAKAASHVPLNVETLDCDFLVFSGHKMLGPSGVGVLYGKASELAQLEPGFYGGGMVANVTDQSIEFAPVPEKFEAGTPPIAGAIGLGIATDYLQALGVGNIHAHVTELIEYGIKTLDAISGITLYAHRNAERNAGVITFTVSDIHAHDVAQILADDNVGVRAGHHCAIPLMHALGVTSTVRASLHAYNTREDIDRLAEGIKKTQKLFA